MIDLVSGKLGPRYIGPSTILAELAAGLSTCNCRNQWSEYTMYSILYVEEVFAESRPSNRARADSCVARADSRVSSAAYLRILGAWGADAAEVLELFFMWEFCWFINLSFVVPIEASEFEVEFFLRGVECDTRFAKKRSWGLFFLFFFPHLVVVLGIWDFVENIHN